MKTIGFTDGGINYKKAIEDGRNAQIEIERQKNAGRKVAIAMTEIAPLRKSNGYDPFSVKYFIETIISKLGNIEEGQFSHGRTYLLVDLKLIRLLSSWNDEALAIYQEKMLKSFVSGSLWNIAFGKIGDNIFKAIEFEGKENIEGVLNINGVLLEKDYIKALCFRVYEADSISHVVGFYRSEDEDEDFGILQTFCDFLNDDKNSYAYEYLQK